MDILETAKFIEKNGRIIIGFMMVAMLILGISIFYLDGIKAVDNFGSGDVINSSVLKTDLLKSFTAEMGTRAAELVSFKKEASSPSDIFR